MCRHRPIFPGRRQPSIFGTDELNCRVRYGNGWSLIVINTDYECPLYIQNRITKDKQCNDWKPAPNTFCRSSPRLISIGQLNTLLCVHLRPINDVVYIDPYSKKDGRTYLRGSFTLRCFQRLSRPYIATQLCRWHDNWCTRGTSIPVLSY